MGGTYPAAGITNRAGPDFRLYRRPA